MGTFFKALFAAPLTGLLALIAALPYLLPIAGLVILHPWFTVSPGQAAAISSFINEFPTRFGWPALRVGIDPVLLVEIIVIGWFVFLFLYRIQVTAIQMLGIAPQRPLQALFLPAWRWLVLPGMLFVALGIAVVVIGAESIVARGLSLARLTGAVNTVSVADYYADYGDALMAIFGLLLATFALFGLAMEQNATGIRVRIHMVLRDMPSVLILGAVHGVLSVVSTVSLFQAAQLLLPEPYVSQYATLWLALIVNATLFFTLMSAACSFLLKRQLLKVVAFGDA